MSRLVEMCGDPIQLFGSDRRREAPVPWDDDDAPVPYGGAAPPGLLDFTHGMAGTVIVGAQWGDEGKGKVIDLLAEQTRTSSSASRAATTPATRSCATARSGRST